MPWDNSGPGRKDRNSGENGGRSGPPEIDEISKRRSTEIFSNDFGNRRRKFRQVR